MKAPLVYIKHSSKHHAQHSGYARLTEHIPGRIISGIHSPLPYRLRKVISNLMDQSYGIYDSSSVGKELALSYQMALNRNGIAHFLNGERDIRFATLIKNKRNWNFLATFHEPPDVIKRCITNNRYVKRLDGAIAVGMNQLNVLADILGHDEVTFIPHGVDTDFFSPSEEEWHQYSCLFVGQHLRDFESLTSTVDILCQRFPEFVLNVVVNKEFAYLLPCRNQVKIYSGISDEELRALYRGSSALLLPLKEVTACNAILEALACGLPVITTQLEGNESYINDSCALLASRNGPVSMAEMAGELMRDEALNRKMRTSSRETGLLFSWQKISETMKAYYNKFSL